MGAQLQVRNKQTLYVRIPDIQFRLGAEMIISVSRNFVIATLLAIAAPSNDAQPGQCCQVL